MLIDQSSFAKIDVHGPGACAFLDRMCANEVDRPLGSVIYTQLLNARGGIEADVTLVRLGERPLPVRDRHGVRLAQPRLAAPAPARGRPVYVDDITSARTCYCLWGPRARDILQPLTKTDLSHEAFPYMRAREIAVGTVPLLASRVTYVGELGWELYAPGRVRPRALRPAARGRRAARPARRRLPRDRVDAAGEGLPRLGHRPDARDDARVGRRRLRRAPRQGHAVHRPGGAARRARGRRARRAARLPRARRPALGLPRLRARAHRRRALRPRHLRRLRQPRAAQHRARLRARRARRAPARAPRSRCSASGYRPRSWRARSTIQPESAFALRRPCWSTITFISRPTASRSARRSSRLRAWRCTPRAPAQRGIDHVCLTEHCHRFRQAAGLFDHPFWNESAKADLDAYVDRRALVRAARGVRHRARLDRGPRGGDRGAGRRAAASTSCSARCTGSAASPSITPTTRSGRSCRPTRSGGATSPRCARPPPRGSSTCSRISTWPRCSAMPRASP